MSDLTPIESFVVSRFLAEFRPTLLLKARETGEVFSLSDYSVDDGGIFTSESLGESEISAEFSHGGCKFFFSSRSVPRDGKFFIALPQKMQKTLPTFERGEIVLWNEKGRNFHFALNREVENASPATWRLVKNFDDARFARLAKAICGFAILPRSAIPQLDFDCGQAAFFGDAMRKNPFANLVKAMPQLKKGLNFFAAGLGENSENVVVWRGDDAEGFFRSSFLLPAVDFLCDKDERSAGESLGLNESRLLVAAPVNLQEFRSGETAFAEISLGAFRRNANAVVKTALCGGSKSFLLLEFLNLQRESQRFLFENYYKMQF